MLAVYGMLMMIVVCGMLMMIDDDCCIKYVHDDCCVWYVDDDCCMWYYVYIMYVCTHAQVRERGAVQDAVHVVTFSPHLVIPCNDCGIWYMVCTCVGT